MRAPGVKWTQAAANVELPAGAATASMYTSPVNQSAGPLVVSMLLRVICMRGSYSSAGVLAGSGVAVQLASRSSASAERLPGSAL